MESAVNAKQWKKAVQIIQVIDDSSGELNKYYYHLGQHFASVKEYRMAEKFYSDGGMHKHAIEMYNGAGMWQRYLLIPLNSFINLIFFYFFVSKQVKYFTKKSNWTSRNVPDCQIW